MGHHHCLRTDSILEQQTILDLGNREPCEASWGILPTSWSLCRCLCALPPLERPLCPVLDVFALRKTSTPLALVLHINLVSVVEKLVDLVTLDQLADTSEIREAEVALAVLIEELEAFVDI